MKLLEITPATGSRLFHDVGRWLYAGDPNWIAPLDMEVETVFDPKKNSSFKHGEAVRWVLQDDSGLAIGRIAAFVDFEQVKRKDPAEGGVGFFECPDDQAAADLMFDAARDWLAARGVQAIDGSINFGPNFNFWGVLVEGFMPQGYGMPYNKPYYARLFDTYGFQEYYRQFSYHKDLAEPFPERMVKFAEHLIKKGTFTFRHYEKKHASRYVGDLAEILNRTWADYMEDYQPVALGEIEHIMKSAKPVIVDEFIWFAYKDGKPIGVVATFPDVKQVLARFDGRLNFWKTLRFLRMLSGKTITRNRVLMAGIVPEFQNSGVIAPLFLQFVRAVEARPHYKEIELSWVGDYNPRMRKIYEQIGGVQKKAHVTYRYLLDRSRPFVRFTNEGGNSALRRDVVGKEG
jgi:hypothetical protein